MNISIRRTVAARLLQLRMWTRKQDTRDRLSGWGITLLFLLVLYGLAAVSDVSTGAYATRVLTFTSVVNPPAAPVAPSPAGLRPTPGPPRERIPSMPARDEIALNRTLSRGGVLERRVIQRRDIDGGSQITAFQRPEISVDPARPIERSQPYTPNLNQRRLPIPGRPVLPSAEVPRLRRGAESGLSLPLQDRSAPQERTVIDVPDIRVFDETTLTADDERTAHISDWVRDNPKTVPDVVRRHMDHMDGDFTTSASILVDGREVDIYLLVRGSYEQLQVVLVDGSRSFLFFDRGLTKQASRFRVGSVSRSSEGITRIVSQEREITSAEAYDFYRIFLEWWESTESR